MELIDTHSHLSSLEVPLSDVLNRSKEHHVTKLICVGSSEGTKSAGQAVEIAKNNANIWATVGIHPHSAGEYQTLSGFEHYLDNPKVVAIGETGLDFYRDWSPTDAQYTLFKNSVAFAINHQKPLIIHCRDAKSETLKILTDMQAYKVGGVVHCYVEDAEFAKQLEQINFSVSFTGIITFPKTHALQQAAATIPLSQIMLETDCPYMAPVPYRGKPSEPMHVYQIAEKLAELKEISLEEVAQTTTNNAIRLFGLVSISKTDESFKEIGEDARKL